MQHLSSGPEYCQWTVYGSIASITSERSGLRDSHAGIYDSFRSELNESKFGPDDSRHSCWLTTRRLLQPVHATVLLESNHGGYWILQCDLHGDGQFIAPENHHE